MKLLWKLFMAAMAIVGIVTVVVCWLGGGIYPPAHSRTAATSAHVTVKSGNPSTLQWVAWETAAPNAPAHYLNESAGETVSKNLRDKLSTATTACGAKLTDEAQLATVEEMKFLKRTPCPACVATHTKTPPRSHK